MGFQHTFLQYKANSSWNIRLTGGVSLQEESEQKAGQHLTGCYELTLYNKFSLRCIFRVQLHELYFSTCSLHQLDVTSESNSRNCSPGSRKWRWQAERKSVRGWRCGSEGCATSPPGDLYRSHSSPTLRASTVNQEDVMSPLRGSEFLFFAVTDVLFL